MMVYRGESVSDTRPNQARVEVIRRFHKTGQGLWTEMANNGDPYKVVSLGLLEATRKHVAFDLRLGKTHFLSFSADQSRALFYAGAHDHDENEVVSADRAEDDVWPYTRYAVFQFDISRRMAVNGLPGVSTVRYGGTHTAFAIDVVAFLQSQSKTGSEVNHQVALQNASTDSEWLILPADPLTDGTLSALLHKSDELTAKHFVDEGYFIDR